MRSDVLIYHMRLTLTEKKLILVVYVAQTMLIVIKHPQTQSIPSNNHDLTTFIESPK